MKKTISFLLGVAITSVISAQGLRVDSGGSLSVYNNASLRVDGDLTVGLGMLTVNSTATDSGSLIVTGTKTGDVTYNRYINDTNWHLVAAPVTTQSINDFAITHALNNQIATSTNVTGNYAVAVYNNGNAAGSQWEYYNTAAGGSLPAIASAGNFVTAKGYSTKRASAGTYTFTGELAQAVSGDVSIAVPVDAPSPTVTHLWSLVGNPYTAFLPVNTNANASNLITANAGLFATNFEALYIWDGSAYVALNNSTPDNVYIAPGQAFFINPIGAGNFVFPESMQTGQENATATFYREAATPEVVISLSNGIDNSATTLRYFNNSTLGADRGYDAGAFHTGEATLSINTHLVADSEGVDFTIQCLPNADFETTVVPLSVKAAANQKLVFNATNTNLPEGINVYLEDKVAQTFTDISNSNYEIKTTNAVSGIGRFYVHTASRALSVEDANQALNALNIYKTSNTSVRVASLQNGGAAQFRMYAISGKEIMSRTFEMQTVNDIAIPSNLASGIYLINVATSAGKQTKKIIIE